MNSPTRVCIEARFPSHDHSNEDERTFLCYDSTTPPWDQDFFYIKDERERSWFCHESKVELSRVAIENLAKQIQKEYAPKTDQSLQRRLHSPLIIHVVLSRVATLDELRGILGIVEHPSKEAT